MLDLGTGSGLQAIAAKKAGADLVLAADIDAVALVATTLNAAANGVSVELTVEDLLAAAPKSFDVVLVGDLYYERRLAERVSRYIDLAVEGGSLILVGDPQRNYFPRTKFHKADEYPVPVTRELEDALIKNTAVWRWEPPKPQPGRANPAGIRTCAGTVPEIFAKALSWLVFRLVNSAPMGAIIRPSGRLRPKLCSP